MIPAFGRHSVRPTQIFRCYEALRWLGGLMCAFASLAGLGIFLTGGAGLVIGSFFGVVYGGLGARVARVGVFETPDYLLVRNRFRTRRVRWDEITTFDFWERPRYNVRERWCGALGLASGKWVWLDATETIRSWLQGNFGSYTGAEARAGLAQIEAVWQTHRAPV